MEAHELGGVFMRSAGRLVAAAAATAACAALAAPAHAADRFVVPGSTTLGDRTSLTYVGCADFFGSAATPPALRINRGPQTPPLGRRSFGLHVSGAGTAAGAVHRTLSLASLGPVSMSVNPESAATGVAYTWYISPDLPVGQAWLGRAELAAGPGWQRVDVSGASFTWQAHDLATRQPQGPATSATLPGFVAAHGDGPGYVMAGFGCNGASFHLDALAYGPLTYDLEGFPATTSIAAEEAGAGKPVTLRGWSERDTGRRLGDPLVLERQVPGTSGWEPVTGPLLADPDAVVRTTVEPEVPTYYRWRMPDSEYADTNVSAPVLVTAVAAPEATPAADGTGGPVEGGQGGDAPEDQAGNQEQGQPGDQPKDGAKDQPKDKPKDKPTP